jgi:hypothetical protein
MRTFTLALAAMLTAAGVIAVSGGARADELTTGATYNATTSIPFNGAFQCSVTSGSMEIVQ